MPERSERNGYNNENKSSKGYASQKLKPVEIVYVDKCELFNMLYYANFLDEQRQKFNERCKEWGLTLARFLLDMYDE